MEIKDTDGPATRRPDPGKTGKPPIGAAWPMASWPAFYEIITAAFPC